MAFSLLSQPPLHPHFISLKPPPPRPRFFLRRRICASAIGPEGKFYPDPSDDDPPEAPEDAGHGVSIFEQIERQASRARRREEEDFKKNQSTFLAAIADVEDAPEDPGTAYGDDSGDDLFGEIDKAIAMKRKEFVEQGLLKPNPKKVEGELVGIEELQPEEVVDLEEIDELQGLTTVSDATVSENFSGQEEDKDGGETKRTGSGAASSSPSFDMDFDSFDKTARARIIEPKFKTSLAELLDESKVVPISVSGDLDVEITGINHDSRLVSAGDLFVCCVGLSSDGHDHLGEAEKRGAVAVVASKEVDLSDHHGCKALVIVDDTAAVLPALAAAFFRRPSTEMAVIGITGTNGKTTTTYLVKSVYEAMGLRCGMLTTVANFVHGENKLEPSLNTNGGAPPNTTPDAVAVQSLMAKMVRNGAEAVVMEASSHGLTLGRCGEVDFDVAVFTNLTRDHLDFHGSMEEYRAAKGKLFARMVDPARHRKVVNLDDPSASFFVAQGSPDVPVVTFAIDDRNADVHPVKFELTLFETQVLINTPQGMLEISSGLLGRHNIYNILAAVSVGIAVGAPLEDIVRGIEEVDAVPGRCELIDEEQAFGVIVDYAHTPDALSRLLDSVKELGAKRVITVIGCGGDRDRGKRPMMAKIATDKSDITILTSDNPRNEDPLDILDDMLCGVGWTMQDYLKHGENDYYPPLPNGHRLFVHDIRRVAVRCAVAMGEEGDMVVVAGKGHETYQIEGDKNEFFDDREECREALQYVDELHQAGIDTSEFPWRLPESH